MVFNFSRNFSVLDSSSLACFGVSRTSRLVPVVFHWTRGPLGEHLPSHLPECNRQGLRRGGVCKARASVSAVGNLSQLLPFLLSVCVCLPPSSFIYSPSGVELSFSLCSAIPSEPQAWVATWSEELESYCDVSPVSGTVGRCLCLLLYTWKQDTWGWGEEISSLLSSEDSSEKKASLP